MKNYEHVLFYEPMSSCIFLSDTLHLMKEMALLRGIEAYNKKLLSIRSNNWLRMHGYPMRRKPSRKRKAH